MSQPTENLVQFPQESSKSVLDGVLRDGAQQMLARAIEAEVAAYIAGRSDEVDASGHRLVVRNGYLPRRTIQTPMGAVEVKQPRVRDRRSPGSRETFGHRFFHPTCAKRSRSRTCCRGCT